MWHNLLSGPFFAVLCMARMWHTSSPQRGCRLPHQQLRQSEWTPCRKSCGRDFCHYVAEHCVHTPDGSASTVSDRLIILKKIQWDCLDFGSSRLCLMSTGRLIGHSDDCLLLRLPAGAQILSYWFKWKSGYRHGVEQKSVKAAWDCIYCSVVSVSVIEEKEFILELKSREGKIRFDWRSMQWCLNTALNTLFFKVLMCS